MKSDIEDIIEAYEIEKKELENQISSCIEEEDYLFAHHHQKALKLINRRLDILKTFQNPLYLHISKEEQAIAYIKKMLNSGNNPYGTYVFEQYLTRSENELLRLRSEVVGSFYDSQEIDDALFSIAHNKASGFKLYLSDDSGFYFSFGGTKIGIDIQMRHDQPEEMDQLCIFSKPHKLKNLGFSLVDGIWTYHYLFSVFKDATIIKTLLAHLIYDYFQYDVGLKSGRIEYII